jgi:RHS repeat-associated protein
VVEYFIWNGQREEFYRGGVEAFSPTPMLLAMRHFPEGTQGQSYWYHLDGRGSVAGITQHQGQSTHHYRYDAYGQVLPAQGNWTDPHNHYTFLGKEWDEHLGLYEFGVRLYDPWAGVWLTREPLAGDAWEPRTWHRYGYAFANPISYYDPYGLQVSPLECKPGEICYTGTMPPYNVQFSPSLVPVPTSGSRLTPTGSQQSCIGAYLSPARERLVKRYATLYGIPWQVLAGLLQSEIQLDTTWMDAMENAVLFSLYVGAHLLLNPSSGLSRLALQGVLWVRPNPGPGIGNVHVATARKVSEYYALFYGQHPELQLGLHTQSTADIAFELLSEQRNIQVVAAYTRMLADYRFGSGGEPLRTPHEDLSQWTLEDALAIWYGYRAGVERVSPPARGYGFGIVQFQMRGLGVGGLLQVASGGLKEESILGAIPYFQCYFERSK